MRGEAPEGDSRRSSPEANSAQSRAYRVKKRLKRAGGIALVPLSLAPFALVLPDIVSREKTVEAAIQRVAGAQSPRRALPFPAAGAVIAPGEARDRWPSFLPARDAVPVLAYHGITTAGGGLDITQGAFAEQLEMLDRAGFETITPHQFVRFRRGDTAGLPERPILLTVDDSRLDSFRGADAVLERHGYRATMFVLTGPADAEHPFHLHWDELRAMQASGRWDLQEHAAAGHRRIPIDAAGRQGPFFANLAYRDGRLESLRDFRRRVRDDLDTARSRLIDEIPGYRPDTFAVPFGDFGQNEHNDRRIAPLMRRMLASSYAATFTQNTAAYATPDAAPTDLQRYEVGADTTADDLYRWLRDHRPGRGRP